MKLDASAPKVTLQAWTRASQAPEVVARSCRATPASSDGEPRIRAVLSGNHPLSGNHARDLTPCRSVCAAGGFRPPAPSFLRAACAAIFAALPAGPALLAALLAALSFAQPALAQCGIGWNLAAAVGPGSYEICYDEARERTVLFSGTTTYEWDGVAWETVAISGPPDRGAAAMVYDPVLERCLLFGGYSSVGGRKDLWSWNGATWTQLASAPAEAAGRGDFAMAFDRGRNRLVVHGGWPGSGSLLTDTLEYDPSTNTWQRWATGPIGHRYAHRMAYDEARGEIILHGGYYYGNRGDTWRWNGSSWTQASGSGPARYVFGLTYDSRRHQVVLHGGTTCCGEVEYPQTYLWNGASWTQCALEGPARGYMNVAYDRARDAIVLAGGVGPSPSGRAGSTETWELVMSVPPATRHVPAQHATIQAAVDACASGDTVVVSPGTYVESVNLRGKAIEVRSAKPHAAAVLAPEGQRSFVFHTGETSATRVVGFLVGKSASTGGGASTSGSSPVIDSCRFEACVNHIGGGAEVNGGGPDFLSCEFVECVSTYSGGSLYASGGALRKVGGDVEMIGCVFRDCRGYGNAHSIMQEGGALRVDEGRFVSDSAGGGAQIYNAYGTLTIEDSLFESMTTTPVFGWAPYTVRRTTFRDIVGFRVMEMRSGQTIIDACAFEHCRVDGYLFGVVYGGTYALSNSSFCDYTTPLFQGGWTDLGGNVFEDSCTCFGDLDENGAVDGGDLAAVLFGWNAGAKGSAADLSGDGVVNGVDLALLLSVWGSCE